MNERSAGSPYIIDKKILKRFDQRKTIFGRMMHDKNADFYQKGLYSKVPEKLDRNEEGYSRIDFARMIGSWTVYDYFHSAFSWEKLSQSHSVMDQPCLEKQPIEDIGLMTEEIKKTAKKYGASLVGITKINRDWVYSHNRDGERIEIPEEFEYAIVMAIKMDPDAIKTSPRYTACIETGTAYSKMAFCIGNMAEFLRTLGYKAIPMGNDTSLSIPLAIDAGLGELGRNGLLITPEYGPCVRICKVFTDMPLQTDEPVEFGVQKKCRRCNRCAEACEVDAIGTDPEPSFKIACPSNNKGILRWAVNHDECYKFWIENGGECSNCISACPYFPK